MVKLCLLCRNTASAKLRLNLGKPDLRVGRPEQGKFQSGRREVRQDPRTWRNLTS